MKRLKTDLIVIHCSATRGSQVNVDRALIDSWHKAKGWAGIGYHFVIKRDGTIEEGRPIGDIGAHVEGFNSRSVGVCLAGGLLEDGRGFDNEPTEYTQAQWLSARELVARLRFKYPDARVVGHRDLSPDANKDGKIQQTEWLKSCPGFSAEVEFSNI